MTAEDSPPPHRDPPTPVEIRGLTAADVPAVVALYESLDAHDGYLRFFAAPPRDISTLVSKLTTVDRGHAAIGAFDSAQLIGVANLVRLDDPGTAEVALVVRHDHQLHGIGSALLAALVETARDRGIHTLVAEVLLENATMLKVIAETGLRTRRRREGSATHIEIELGGQLEPEAHGHN